MSARQHGSTHGKFAHDFKRSRLKRPVLTLGAVALTALVACQGAIDSSGTGGSGSNGSGASGSGASGSGASGGTTGSGSGALAGPSAAPLRRLTSREYHNTVRDLFPGITLAEQSFPPPVAVDGFENAHLSLPPTSLLAESEYAAADAIATRVVAERSRFISCAQEDLACARSAAEKLIAKAYRRPATSAERDRMLTFVGQSFTAGGFEVALHDLVQALLLTPQFLFRPEFAEAAATTGLADLSSYELASRLSYFLWETMPDQALLDAAAAGQLSEPQNLVTHAKRLLADPRAHTVVADFHRQWLELDRLNRLTLDAAAFPELTDPVRGSLRTSLERFVDWAFWDQRSSAAMFGSEQVFANATLAPFLGVNVSGDSLVRVAAPNRKGLLTQPGLLASSSHGTLHSPVLRGVQILRKFLCFNIPPPPPNVVTSVDPIPAGSARTTREHFELTHKKPDCASCHNLIDPAGYALENYDALGRYVTEENGVRIDSRGGLPIGSTGRVEVNGGVELGTALAASSEVRACLASHWFRFAFGRSPTSDGDRSEIANLAETLKTGAGDPQALLIAIVQSTSFRKRPAREL